MQPGRDSVFPKGNRRAVVWTPVRLYDESTETPITKEVAYVPSTRCRTILYQRGGPHAHPQQGHPQAGHRRLCGQPGFAAAQRLIFVVWGRLADAWQIAWVMFPAAVLGSALLAVLLRRPGDD